MKLLIALAGNLELIVWLKERKTFNSKDEDAQGMLAFDYALAHCQENGINFKLLAALCDKKIIDQVQDIVSETLNDSKSSAFILHGLMSLLGPKVIIKRDGALFLQAILNDYNELADRLAGFDDYNDVLSDEILELAPEVDERLIEWAKAYDVDFEWIEEQLCEFDLALFRANRGYNEDTSSASDCED